MRPVVCALVAAALLVAAAVGAYGVYQEQQAAGQTTPSPSILSYTQEGRFGYDAQLAPNSLYPGGHLTPGNGTLFREITNWVNVSFLYGLTADRPVDTAIQIELAVLLTTPAWSQPVGLVSSFARSGGAVSTSAAIDYPLDVAAVQALERQIENETGYLAPSFTVSFEPLVLTAVQVGASTVYLRDAPAFVLNFTGPTITPSNLTSSVQGISPGGGTGATTAGPWGSVYAPMLLLIGAGGLFGGVAWRGWTDSRRPRAVDVDRLIAPYREGVATVREAPRAEEYLAVAGFEDLVRVADTLGRPILRHRPGTDAGPRTADWFYVVDGSVAFVYAHSQAAGPSVAPPRPAARAPDARAAIVAGVREILPDLRTARQHGRPKPAAESAVRDALRRARAGDVRGARRAMARARAALAPAAEAVSGPRRGRPGRMTASAAP